jgi:hypothetical protein
MLGRIHWGGVEGEFFIALSWHIVFLIALLKFLSCGGRFIPPAFDFAVTGHRMTIVQFVFVCVLALVCEIFFVWCVCYL